MPFGEQRVIYSLLFGEVMDIKEVKEDGPDGGQTLQAPPVDLGVSALFRIFELPSPSPVFMLDEELELLNKIVRHVRGADDDLPEPRRVRAQQLLQLTADA